MDVESSSRTNGTQIEAMDEEFLRGLESILGPMRASGASEEEIQNITSRARQFYMSRRPAPDSASNGDQAVQQESAAHPASTNQTGSSDDIDQSRGQLLTPDATTDDQPRYPLSFDELAELIATGGHIPGIRQIPDKLNEEQPSEPILARRQIRKPWEEAAESRPVRDSLSALIGEERTDQ